MEKRSEFVDELADAFDNFATAWKVGGWGSNPADQQTIAFAVDTLNWLRSVAGFLREMEAENGG